MWNNSVPTLHFSIRTLYRLLVTVNIGPRRNKMKTIHQEAHFVCSWHNNVEVVDWIFSQKFECSDMHTLVIFASFVNKTGTRQCTQAVFSCSITWPNLPCLPDREWRVNLLLFSFGDENFNKNDYKIDQSIAFSQSTTYWVGELENNELHCCLVKYQSIHVAV